MHFTYKTHGTCSSAIDFDVENNVLTNVVFTGGCNGNLKGIGSLVEGMNVDEVIRRLKGTPLRLERDLLPRPTGSSPDAGPGKDGPEGINTSKSKPDGPKAVRFFIITAKSSRRSPRQALRFAMAPPRLRSAVGAACMAARAGFRFAPEFAGSAS